MPLKYKRCVAKVAKHSGMRSAHAICTASNAGNIRQVRKAEARKVKTRGRS